MPSSPTTTQAARRLIAAVEALKGVIALLAASGVLALVHQDLNAWAMALVRHTHLNPAAHYPQVFLEAVAHLDQPRLLWLALGAATYAALRLAEAYGLYRDRAWAEWLAALSGGLYLPFEFAELIKAPSWLTTTTLLLNLAVVAVMAQALAARRRALQ